MSFSSVLKKALETINRSLEEGISHREEMLQNSARILNLEESSSSSFTKLTTNTTTTTTTTTTLPLPSRYNFLDKQYAFVYLMFESPKRLGILLNIASNSLAKNTAFLNTTFWWLSRSAAAILALGICAGSYKAWIEYTKLQDLLESEQARIQLEEQCKGWLGEIIIRHVYYNTGIENNLTGLTVNLCNKPSIRHNTVKALGRIYEIRDVRRSTPTLIKGVLRNSVYYDEFITKKLVTLLSEQLKSPVIRQMLLDVLVEFTNTPLCRDFLAFELSEVLQNQGVLNQMRGALFSNAHFYLEDLEMRKNIVAKMRATISGTTTPSPPEEQQESNSNNQQEQA